MLPEVEKDYENLRRAYYDILRGYSIDEDSGIFVKHITEFEICSLYDWKAKILKTPEAASLPMYKGRFDELVNIGAWSQEKEDELTSLEFAIADNSEFLSKITVAEQKEILQLKIDQIRGQLHALQQNKKQIFGPTREEYADRESNNYIVLLSLFKDRELKNPVLTWKEYEELYDEDFSNYLKVYYSATQFLTNKNIYRIACMSFFNSPFSYCRDNPHAFFGKPISQLTLFQYSLLSCGSKVALIQTKCAGSPPDLSTVPSIDKITYWYDTQYSILSSSGSSEEHGVRTSRKTVVRS